MNDDRFRKLDVIETTQVPVSELTVGMYVAELDRPWEETPFLFQGFEIKSESDIDTLAKFCRHVYVDMHKTRMIRPEFGKPHVTPGNYFHTSPLPHSTGFCRELEAARSTKDKTENLVKTFMDDIRFGRSIDVQQAKAAVVECVASITRNPEALMFLTQIRNRDEYTSEHSLNVCVYAIVLGRHAGLDVHELENLGTCGLLHDMGKVAIPPDLLKKSTPLTADEFELMKKHTIYGRDILMSSRNLFNGAVDVAYAHHENIDGTGYPRQLEGHQLSQNTKIVAVVDRYDAITADRVYQRGRTHMEAITLLNKSAADRHTDHTLTQGFVSTLGAFPPGSVVELSSGEIAVVLRQNASHRLRPQVVVVRDQNKQPEPYRYVDLAEVDTDDTGKPYNIRAMHRPSVFGIHLSNFQSEMAAAFG
jgi:HD-GYP domain-containing protein (c-di-GMP phosphodiesterase class II)